MEKKTQATSSPKSPVFKMCASPTATDKTPQPSNDSNSTIHDSAYQDSSNKDIANGHKVAPTSSEPPCPGDSSGLTHPIISVDIKKTIPSSENKQQAGEVSLEEVTIREQTTAVASVVTNAVVSEATLAVGGSNSPVTNGVKPVSDYRKVDERVQEELSRIAECSSPVKPVLNGDIAHSSASQDVSPMSPKESAAGVSSVKGADSTKNGQSDTTGTCNGVVGIITVETISRKEIAVEVHKSDESSDASCTNTAGVKETSNAEVITQAKCIDQETDRDRLTGANGSSNPKQLEENCGESIVKTNTAKDDCSPGNCSEKIDGLMRDDKLKTDNVTDSAKLFDASAVGVDVEHQNITDCAKLSGKGIRGSSGSGPESATKESDSGSARVNELVDKEASDKAELQKASDLEASSEEISKDVIESDVQTNVALETNSEKLAADSSLVSNSKDEAAENAESGDRDDKAEVKTTSDQGTSETQTDKAQPRDAEEASAGGESDSKSVEVSQEAADTLKADSSQSVEADDAESEKESSVAQSPPTTTTTNGPDSVESAPQRIIRRDADNEEKADPSLGAADVPRVEESCKAAASRMSPETRDVGVGLDEVRTVRVASGDGGLEEIDGQQASAEVEVADDSMPTDTEEVAEAALPAEVEGQATPTSARSPSPTVGSKPSSALSGAEPEHKPPSAVSRSSIPDPVVYEPPERRKSAVSAASEADSADKSGGEADLADVQESDKSEATPETQDAPEEAQKGDDVDEATATGDNTDEVELLEDTKSQISAAESEAAETKEQPVEIAETESDDTKPSDGEVTTEDQAAEEPSEAPGDSTTETSKDVEPSEPPEDSAAEASKEEQHEDGAEQTADCEADDKGATVAEGAVDANEAGDTDVAAAAETEAEKETEVDGAAAPEEEGAKEKDEDDEIQTQEEPETLVAEVSTEKEAATPEDKESDDTEREGAPSKGEGEAEKKDEQEEDTAKEDAADEAVAAVVQEQSEEKAEEAPSTEDASKEEGDAPKDVEQEENDQPKDDDDKKEGAADDDDAAAEEEKRAEEEAKQEEEKQDQVKEEGEVKEKSPRSPTKRMRSPDKMGRRGVSPLSSPPKPMKAPTSPQKPQKTPSPKKKNGMLSPIKTPKTPGSDIRKLPPIKAPVGLAPNPNLKNIRSKIGSFDNIRYKPGGGDKKVISKKLEWKAAPKIGSLDNASYKVGEKKKERTKSESKEAKSPVPSGDEGEAEGATAADTAEEVATDSVDATGALEMPPAIAAES